MDQMKNNVELQHLMMLKKISLHQLLKICVHNIISNAILVCFFQKIEQLTILCSNTPNCILIYNNKIVHVLGLCIEDSWVCDEIFDCDQGEDESNCKNNNFVGRCKNNSREFKCRISGSCISIEKVCDGTPQCPDASDEMFCTNNNQSKCFQ